MATMLMYGRTLKNLLLQHQKSYDLETWHAALVTEGLQSFYINDDPGLNLFTAWSNLVSYAFVTKS